MEYIDGTVKYNVINLVNGGGGGGVLPGVILAFSGMFDDDGYPLNVSTGAADKGWHLCDGTNGTPDLRGRFILGASASHATGTTGGEEAHSLTPDENAPHDHAASCGKAGLHKHEVYGADDNKGGTGAFDTQSDYQMKPKVTYPTSDAGLHAHEITIGVSGKGAPHNNMPPYYTLSYIMKL